MNDLPDDLRGLTGGQPDVADWPGLVRRAARRRARRRQAAAGLGVVGLLVLVGAGATALETGGVHHDQVLEAPSETPAPTSTAHARLDQIVPVPAPTESVTPASPLPTDAPSAAVAPPSPAAAAPTPSATPRTLEQTVDLDRVVSGLATMTAGGTATFRWHGRWSAERPRPSLSCEDCDRGDVAVYSAGACPAPEEGHPAEPGQDDFSAQLTIHDPGTFHVRLRLDADCNDYYRGSASRVVTVVVTASEPSPSASPTDSPTP